ncbi:O-antigen ligase family protein [Photobacterium sp. DNB22_13_2]
MKLDKDVLIHSIILLPLIWCFSGVFAFANGDKIFNVLVPLAVIARLYFFGHKDILTNIKKNKFLWLLLLNLLFSIVAYFTYGISSNRLRMLSLGFIYLSILPPSYLKSISFRNLTWTVSGSLILFLLIQYYSDVLLFRTGWSINPIRIGTVSAFLVNANLYLALSESNKKLKLISLGFAVIAFFPLLLSFSRGPLLAFTAGLMVLSFRVINIKSIALKHVFTSILILVSITITLKEPIQHRVKTTVWEVKQINSDKMDTSIGLRLQMWKAGLEIIHSNWLLGVGNNGQLEIKSQMVKDKFITPKAANFAHFHNQWIDDLAKYGIFGLIGTMSLILYPLFAPNKENKTLILVLITIYLTVCLTDVPLERSHPLIFYIFSTFLLLRRNEIIEAVTIKDKSVNNNEVYSN